MNFKLRILPLLIAAMLTSCTPAENEQMSKNVISMQEIINQFEINWLDSLNQNEEHYLVFFYSETCPHCHEIMEDVIEFAKEDLVKTYFSNIKKYEPKITIQNDVVNTIGLKEIDDFFIAGTPSILEVKNAIVNNNIPGKDNCLTFLNKLRLELK